MKWSQITATTKWSSLNEEQRDNLRIAYWNELQKSLPSKNPGQDWTSLFGTPYNESLVSEGQQKAQFTPAQFKSSITAPKFKDQGNIDLFNRPMVVNDDGSLSTVRSMSFGEDGKEILIPTIRHGLNRPMTNDEAIDWYHKTGEFLGKFDSIDEADQYAKLLHEQQAKLYRPQGQSESPAPGTLNMPKEFQGGGQPRLESSNVSAETAGRAQDYSAQRHEQINAEQYQKRQQENPYIESLRRGAAQVDFGVMNALGIDQPVRNELKNYLRSTGGPVKPGDELGLVGNLKAGQYGRSFDYAVRKSLEMAPQSIASMMLQYAGGPLAGFLAMSLPSYGSEMDRIANDPKYSELSPDTKITMAVTNGVIEGVSEMFGNMLEAGLVRDAVQRFGRQAAKNYVATELKNRMTGLLKSNAVRATGDLLASANVEGMEEIIAQVGNNLVETYLGNNPTGALDNTKEAYALGAAGGLFMETPARVGVETIAMTRKEKNGQPSDSAAAPMPVPNGELPSGPDARVFDSPPAPTELLSPSEDHRKDAKTAQPEHFVETPEDDTYREYDTLTEVNDRLNQINDRIDEIEQGSPPDAGESERLSDEFRWLSSEWSRLNTKETEDEKDSAQGTPERPEENPPQGSQDLLTAPPTSGGETTTGINQAQFDNLKPPKPPDDNDGGGNGPDVDVQAGPNVMGLMKTKKPQAESSTTEPVTTDSRPAENLLADAGSPLSEQSIVSDSAGVESDSAPAESNVAGSKYETHMKTIRDAVSSAWDTGSGETVNVDDPLGILGKKYRYYSTRKGGVTPERMIDGFSYNPEGGFYYSDEGKKRFRIYPDDWKRYQKDNDEIVSVEEFARRKTIKHTETLTPFQLQHAGVKEFGVSVNWLMENVGNIRRNNNGTYSVYDPQSKSFTDTEYKNGVDAVRAYYTNEFNSSLPSYPTKEAESAGADLTTSTAPAVNAETSVYEDLKSAFQRWVNGEEDFDIPGSSPVERLFRANAYGEITKEQYNELAEMVNERNRKLKGVSNVRAETIRAPEVPGPGLQTGSDESAGSQEVVEESAQEDENGGPGDAETEAIPQTVELPDPITEDWLNSNIVSDDVRTFIRESDQHLRGQYNRYATPYLYSMAQRGSNPNSPYTETDRSYLLALSLLLRDNPEPVLHPQFQDDLLPAHREKLNKLYLKDAERNHESTTNGSAVDPLYLHEERSFKWVNMIVHAVKHKNWIEMWRRLGEPKSDGNKHSYEIFEMLTGINLSKDRSKRLQQVEEWAGIPGQITAQEEMAAEEERIKAETEQKEKALPFNRLSAAHKLVSTAWMKKGRAKERGQRVIVPGVSESMSFPAFIEWLFLNNYVTNTVPNGKFDRYLATGPDGGSFDIRFKVATEYLDLLYSIQESDPDELKRFLKIDSLPSKAVVPDAPAQEFDAEVERLFHPAGGKQVSDDAPLNAVVDAKTALTTLVDELEKIVSVLENNGERYTEKWFETVWEKQPQQYIIDIPGNGTFTINGKDGENSNNPAGVIANIKKVITSAKKRLNNRNFAIDPVPFDTPALIRMKKDVAAVQKSIDEYNAWWQKTGRWQMGPRRKELRGEMPEQLVVWLTSVSCYDKAIEEFAGPNWAIGNDTVDFYDSIRQKYPVILLKRNLLQNHYNALLKSAEYYKAYWKPIPPAEEIVQQNGAFRLEDLVFPGDATNLRDTVYMLNADKWYGEIVEDASEKVLADFMAEIARLNSELAQLPVPTDVDLLGYAESELPEAEQGKAFQDTIERFFSGVNPIDFNAGRAALRFFPYPFGLNEENRKKLIEITDDHVDMVVEDGASIGDTNPAIGMSLDEIFDPGKYRGRYTDLRANPSFKTLLDTWEWVYSKYRESGYAHHERFLEFVRRLSFLMRTKYGYYLALPKFEQAARFMSSAYEARENSSIDIVPITDWIKAEESDPEIRMMKTMTAYILSERNEISALVSDDGKGEFNHHDNVIAPIIEKMSGADFTVEKCRIISEHIPDLVNPLTTKEDLDRIIDFIDFTDQVFNNPILELDKGVQYLPGLDEFTVNGWRAGQSIYNQARAGKKAPELIGYLFAMMHKAQRKMDEWDFLGKAMSHNKTMKPKDWPDWYESKEAPGASYQTDSINLMDRYSLVSDEVYWRTKTADTYPVRLRLKDLSSGDYVSELLLHPLPYELWTDSFKRGLGLPLDSVSSSSPVADNETIEEIPPVEVVNPPIANTGTSVSTHITADEQSFCYSLATIINETPERIPRDIPTLEELSRKIMGRSRGQGNLDIQHLYNLLETAVNMALSWKVFAPQHEDLWEADLRVIEELQNQLPTQTVRSQDKIDFQQFSTPPGISYLTTLLAHLQPGDVILEPSAGTGSLLPFARKIVEKQNIHANDIDQHRHDLLAYQGYNVPAGLIRAEMIHARMPHQFTRVIMNPPFSSTGGSGLKNSNKVGYRHVAAALDTLLPGGRLVTILGEGAKLFDLRDTILETIPSLKTPTGMGFKFIAQLSLAGGLYRKYGTSFGNTLFVIDKVDSVFGDLPVSRSAKTLQEVLHEKQFWTEIRRTADRGRAVLQDSPIRPLASLDGRRPGDSGIDDPGIGGNRGGDRMPAEPGPGGTPAPLAGNLPGTAEGNLPAGDPIFSEPGNQGDDRDRGGAKQPDAVTGPGESPAGGRRPRKSTGKTGQKSGADTAGTGDNGNARGNDRPRNNRRTPAAVVLGNRPQNVPVVTLERKSLAERKDVEGDDYTFYKPELVYPGSKPHPTSLVLTPSLASITMPEGDYSVCIPREIIEQGRLSDVQLENIAKNHHANSIKSSFGFRYGTLITDGTGTGKGRVIAGTMLDSWCRGVNKHVWFSVSPALYMESATHFKNVGNFECGMNLLDISDFKATQEIPPDYVGAVYFPYSKIHVMTEDARKMAKTIKSVDDRKSIITEEFPYLNNLMNWIGDDECVICIDESHAGKNMGAVNNPKDSGSLRARLLLHIQKMKPNARISYYSATAMSKIDSMPIYARLGLWGPGTVFPEFSAFLRSLGQYQTTGMEMIARDLYSKGRMSSLNLSYEGVEYTEITHELTPSEHRVYNAAADLFMIMLDAAAEVDKITNTPPMERMFRNRQLYGAQQRLFKGLTIAFKVPSILAEIDSSIDEGMSPYLTMYSHRSGHTETAYQAKLAEEGQVEELDMSPREAFLNILKYAVNVDQFEMWMDDDEKVYYKPVLDENNNPIQNPEALKRRDYIMGLIQELELPDNPMDTIVNHCYRRARTEGRDELRPAEISGRTHQYIQIDGEWKKVPLPSKELELNDYQEGRKIIAIATGAGLTGFSAHDDPNRGNNRRRKQIMCELSFSGDQNLQAIGRNHRSGERTKPIIALMSTNIGAEIRFSSNAAMVISNMGALVRGERGAIKSPLDKYDVENDIGQASVRKLSEYRKDEFIRMRLIKENQQTRTRNGADLVDIKHFFNRLLFLPLDDQQRLLSEFFEIFNEAVQAAIDAGTWGKPVSSIDGYDFKETGERIIYADPDSGAVTKLSTIKYKTKPKKVTFAQADKLYWGSANESVDSRAMDRFLPYHVNMQSKVPWVLYRVTTTRNKAGYDDYKASYINPHGGRKDVSMSQYAEEHRDGRVMDYSDHSYSYSMTGKNKNDRSTFIDLWNKALDKSPEFHEKETYVLSGSLLSIWGKVQSKLPNRLDVVKLLIDSPEKKLIGVQIPADIVPSISSIAQEKGKEIGTEDVIRVVSDMKVPYELEHGFVLKATTVSRTPMIEITHRRGYLESMEVSMLRNSYNLQSEINQAKTRFLVPVLYGQVNIDGFHKFLASNRPVGPITKDQARRPDPRFGEGLIPGQTPAQSLFDRKLPDDVQLWERLTPDDMMNFANQGEEYDAIASDSEIIEDVGYLTGSTIKQADIPSGREWSAAADMVNTLTGHPLIVFETVSGNAPQGIYRNGRIAISRNALWPARWLVIHEYLHYIQHKNPTLFAEMLTIAQREVSVPALRSDEYYADYPEALRLIEVLNNTLGRELSNGRFWNRMARRSPSICQRIVDTLKWVWEKIKSAFVAKAKRSDEFFSDLDSLIDQIQPIIDRFKRTRRQSDEQYQRMSSVTMYALTPTGDSRFNASEKLGELKAIQKRLDRLGRKIKEEKLDDATREAAALDSDVTSLSGMKSENRVSEIKSIEDLSELRKTININMRFLKRGVMLGERDRQIKTQALIRQIRKYAVRQIQSDREWGQHEFLRNRPLQELTWKQLSMLLTKLSNMRPEAHFMGRHDLAVRDLDDILHQIDDITAEAKGIAARKYVKRVLKKTRPKKQHSRLTGKLVPHIQSQVDEIRDTANASQPDVALEKELRIQRIAEIRKWTIDQVNDEIEKVLSRGSADREQSIVENIDDEDDPILRPLTVEEINSIVMLNTFGALRYRSAEDAIKAAVMLENLVKTGKFIHEAILKEREQQRNELLSEAMSIITQNQPLKSVNVPPNERNRRPLKVTQFNNNMQSFEFIMDILDSRDRNSSPMNGWFVRHMADTVFSARWNSKEGSLKKQGQIRRAYEEIYGLTGHALDRQLIIDSTVSDKTGVWVVGDEHLAEFLDDALTAEQIAYWHERAKAGLTDEEKQQCPLVELRLSQNEAAKKWMEWKQENLEKTFRRMGWTTETLSECESFIEPRVMNKALWQLDFYKEYYNEVNAVYKEEDFIDLPQNAFYSPIFRDWSGERMDDAMRDAAKQGKVGVRNDHLKVRVNNSHALQYVDCDTVLANHVSMMEHYIHWAKPMRILRGILEDRNLTKAILQNYGAQYVRLIRMYLNAFARNGIEKSLANTFLDRMRGRYTTMALAVKADQVVKQFISFVAYLDVIPAPDFVSGVAEFFTNPVEHSKILMESPIIRARYSEGYDRDIIAAMKPLQHIGRKSDMARVFSGTHTVTQAMLYPVLLGDKLSVMVGGWAVYRYNLKRLIASGRPEQVARQQALIEVSKITKRTQQSGEIEDLSAFQMSSIGKLFTMFMTSPLQFYRLEMTYLRGIITKRGSMSRNLLGFTLFHFVLPALFQWVGNMFRWDWDKEARSALIGNWNALFIGGDLLDSIIDHYYSGFNVGGPVVENMESFGAMIMQAMKLTINRTWTFDDMARVLDEIFSDSSRLLGGIPYDQLKRAGKGVWNLLPETEKKRLLQSIPYDPARRAVENTMLISEDDRQKLYEGTMLLLGWSASIVNRDIERRRLLELISITAIRPMTAHEQNEFVRKAELLLNKRVINEEQYNQIMRKMAAANRKRIRLYGG